MIDGKKAAEELIAKIEQTVHLAAAKDMDVQRMRHVVIHETLTFIDELDSALRSKGFGSIERFSDVRRERRILEIRLHVVILQKSKVLKFGVHDDHIHVGGQRATDEVSHSGPVYSEDELIKWLSDQILSIT